MLPGITGMILSAGSNTRVVEFLSTAISGTSGGFRSFAGYNLGDAAASRRIFVVVHWFELGSGHKSLTSATIGGQSATIHVQSGHSGGASGFGVAIVSALVATGTTGTISLQWSSSVESVRIGAIRTVDMVRSTHYDTASDSRSVTADDLSSSIDIPDNGFLIAGYSGSQNASASVVWLGATEVYDTSGDSMAFAANLSAETNRTIAIITSSQPDAGNALVAVSWN